MTGARTARFAGLATTMFVLAALEGGAGLITGVLLIVHKGQSCTPNPYNDAFGTDLMDCHASYPYAWAGAGVLAGALVSVLVVTTVGRLCNAVAEIGEAADAPAI